VSTTNKIVASQRINFI